MRQETQADRHAKERQGDERVAAAEIFFDQDRPEQENHVQDIRQKIGERRLQRRPRDKADQPRAVDHDENHAFGGAHAERADDGDKRLEHEPRERGPH